MHIENNDADKNNIAVEQIYVAGNRGPCGGVNMAIEAARQVLAIVDGRETVYTNWDLVNNKPLVSKLRKQGLESVQNNWDLAPVGSVVLFSAHGVPPAFRQIAHERNYQIIDVTCQLVTRVHMLAKNAAKLNKHVVYIGVKDHPESVGVLGELGPNKITLLENVSQIEHLELPSDTPLVVYSQTTKSPIEVKRIEEELQLKYPGIEIPSRAGICFATENRQAAVSEMIPLIDALLVVGSQHSHNSKELSWLAERFGVPAYMIDEPDEIDWSWFDNKVARLGLTSGASVLEEYLTPVIDSLREKNPHTKVFFQPQTNEEEWQIFKLPEKAIRELMLRYDIRE